MGGGERGGLGHSLIIIKWSWGFFPKICNLPTPYNQAQKNIHYQNKILLNFCVTYDDHSQFVLGYIVTIGK